MPLNLTFSCTNYVIITSRTFLVKWTYPLQWCNRSLCVFVSFLFGIATCKDFQILLRYGSSFQKQCKHFSFSYRPLTLLQLKTRITFEGLRGKWRRKLWSARNQPGNWSLVGWLWSRLPWPRAPRTYQMQLFIGTYVQTHLKTHQTFLVKASSPFELKSRHWCWRLNYRLDITIVVIFCSSEPEITHIYRYYELA